MAPRSPRQLLLTSTLALALLSGNTCAKPAATQETRTYNFKIMAGISMGAIGASFISGYGDNHKKLDGLGAMGGPIDAAYFLNGFERMQMGGFCPASQLEQLASTSPASMNKPGAMTCPQGVPVAYEHVQDFDDWQFTDNGGDFDRGEYLDLFFDLSLAMGNPLEYDPASPLYPEPSILQTALPLGTSGLPSSVCTQPMVFSMANGNPVYNKEYNPDGTYPVITFCDGQEPIYFCNDPNQTYVDWCQMTDPSQVNSFPTTFCQGVTGATGFDSASSSNNADLFYAKKGHYNPCYPASSSVSFGLAVDYNGNGIRDYYEPVILNGHERFSDSGADGCADAYEDGKGGCSPTPTGLPGDPNHDNYDYLLNPSGTENDWKWEKGEPFEDYGLDGVPNTHDYGEGNGVYDDSPARQNWFKWDFRTNYLSWPEIDRKSFDVYADGGIRDLFNFGLSADIMTSATRQKEPKDSGRFLDFTAFPPLAADKNWSSGYDGTRVDWNAAGRNIFLRYGDVDVTTAQLRSGDGDHVGTVGQAADRTLTFISWASHVWDPVLPAPKPINGSFNVIDEAPYLNTLGAKRNFDIMTPPGYDDPANAKERYPVVVLGHGYGMDPDGMSATGIVFAAYMEAGNIRPMILVFPSGRCCWTNTMTGERDCREENDEGKSFSQMAGWTGECRTGNFYVNRQGFTGKDNTPYADSLFEILDYVDAHYRTLSPKTIPLSEVP
jgi:hypothetical protein